MFKNVSNGNDQTNSEIKILGEFHFENKMRKYHSLVV